MEHVKISFVTDSAGQSEILVAVLSEMGYEGFEETEGELLAYIGSDKFDALELDAVVAPMGVEYTSIKIATQNWNALWESNFQPVQIDDFCIIRADFHEKGAEIDYDIVITPKMSFGTGHHSTTRLVIRMMKDMDLAGKDVLDFGTGTGVLAIFAEMRGAKSVFAIDNDIWPVENTKENIVRNNCNRITAELGSLDTVMPSEYDIILANINRHILLQYMGLLYEQTKKGGYLVMSGLLFEDEAIICEAAIAAGFIFEQLLEEHTWIALRFNKC